MSDEVQSVRVLTGELEISQEGVDWLHGDETRSSEEPCDLIPECYPTVVGDGRHFIIANSFAWHGMGSCLHDTVVLEKLASFTKGTMEVILIGEYEGYMRGVRFRDGVATFHDVELKLKEAT